MPHPHADGAGPRVTPWRREWLSASLGCAVADTIFNPLEVLKVRRQVAMGSAGASVSAVPASTIALARAAIKDKGVYRGLWHPGLEATIYRAFSYTGFRIGMYPAVRDAVVETRLFGDSNSVAARVVAGAGTGAIGSALFNPIDVVRIRMQGPAPYESTLVAFATIARREGVAGLWRGWGACVARAATLSGAQLATYDTAKRRLRSDDPSSAFKEGPLLHFTASLASGVVAQTVTQPADTIKTLVMAAGHDGFGTSLKKKTEEAPGRRRARSSRKAGRRRCTAVSGRRRRGKAR